MRRTNVGIFCLLLLCLSVYGEKKQASKKVKKPTTGTTLCKKADINQLSVLFTSLLRNEVADMQSDMSDKLNDVRSELSHMHDANIDVRDELFELKERISALAHGGRYENTTRPDMPCVMYFPNREMIEDWIKDALEDQMNRLLQAIASKLEKQPKDQQGPSETWRDYQGSCVSGNNNRVINNVTTMNECKKLCETATDFTCWSIDYWVAPKHQCTLSDKYSGNYDVLTPCHVGGVDYAERLPLQVCREYEIVYDNSCYEFVSDRKTAAEAETYCTNKGGHLVDVLSQEENDFLATRLDILLESGSLQYWFIGLRDELEPADSIWTSNKIVMYTNWGGSEPNRDDEKCVTIQSPQWTWHDVICNRQEQFICEYKKND